jgi:hypothetical protein
MMGTENGQFARVICAGLGEESIGYILAQVLA